jgi:hypothetical protein
MVLINSDDGQVQRIVLKNVSHHRQELWNLGQQIIVTI